MTTYLTKDFSFNIGGTNITQRYIDLYSPDVPWGINVTYIYNDVILNPQFSSNNISNQHLVIENKTNNGNIIFKTQGTGKTIITDLSVDLINGVPYSGSGSGSGSGSVGLTLNSVNSSHIQNGSILGIDICDETITSQQLQNNCVTSTKILDTAVSESKLSTELLYRLVALERPKVNLIIYNVLKSTALIPYSIDLNDNGNITSYFKAFQELGIGSSHSVLLNLPNSSTIIVLAIDTTNITIIDYSIYSGATVAEFSNDSLSFTLNSGSSNIQVYFEVYSTPKSPRN
jgi:hypothetical protein